MGLLVQVEAGITGVGGGGGGGGGGVTFGGGGGGKRGHSFGQSAEGIVVKDHRLAIGLAIFAVPLSIFAVVGVVNSLNMIDGVDGLSGSISFLAFAWYAAVAEASGLNVQFMMALIFCGAIAGFLVFNLRFPWQKHARVFMGDSDKFGSLSTLAAGFGDRLLKKRDLGA